MLFESSEIGRGGRTAVRREREERGPSGFADSIWGRRSSRDLPRKGRGRLIFPSAREADGRAVWYSDPELSPCRMLCRRYLPPVNTYRNVDMQSRRATVGRGGGAFDAAHSCDATGVAIDNVRWPAEGFGLLLPAAGCMRLACMFPHVGPASRPSASARRESCRCERGAQCAAACACGRLRWIRRWRELAVVVAGDEDFLVGAGCHSGSEGFDSVRPCDLPLV